tara:strand:+ start:196 stop:951 length:756 start_codon:yes stop_codon:yes gene_type:complete
MATSTITEPTAAGQTASIPFVGADPGDKGDGDTLREAITRINNRIKEIYGAQNSGGVVQTPFIDGDNIKDNLISGQAQMTGDVEDGDEIMVSDAGVLKKAGFSVVRDAVFNDISGDASIAAGGALTIGNDAVDHDELANRYTAINAIGSTSGSFNIDFSAGAVHTLSLGGNCTGTFTNFKVGQVIDIILSGNYTLTFSATASGTPSINKVGSTDYDGSSSFQVIQVVCTSADSTTPQFLYSVATYADATTP